MGRSLIVGFFLVIALQATLLAQEVSREFVSVQVAEKVIPSLVSVEAVSVINTQLRLFSYSRQQALLEEVGTGVVIDRQGHIISKNEIVEDVDLIRITFSDGTQVDGEVLVKDEAYDIAILKVNPKGLNLHPVKVGDPFTVVPGDSAIIVGNSSSYTGTVTYGIVSARRNYRTPNYVLIPNMIQADAAMNAGNDGAPLFNWKGEMIGLHSNAGQVRGDRANINFFIPSDIVMSIAREMIRTGERPFRPYIGILPFSRLDVSVSGVQSLGDDIRMYFDLPEEYWEIGVIIQDIDAGGPAFEYGLVKGDLIVRVEFPATAKEIMVESVGQLEEMIQGWRDGQDVIFHVLRDNMITEVALEVGPAPEDSYKFFI